MCGAGGGGRSVGSRFSIRFSPRYVGKETVEKRSGNESSEDFNEMSDILPAPEVLDIRMV